MPPTRAHAKACMPCAAAKMKYLWALKKEPAVSKVWVLMLEARSDKIVGKGKEKSQCKHVHSRDGKNGWIQTTCP